MPPTFEIQVNISELWENSPPVMSDIYASITDATGTRLKYIHQRPRSDSGIPRPRYAFFRFPLDDQEIHLCFWSATYGISSNVVAFKQAQTFTLKKREIRPFLLQLLLA